MVNSKQAVFKVNKQTPSNGPPPQAYSTVINCRKPTGKRAGAGPFDVQTHRVRLTKIPGVQQPEPQLKRKRATEDDQNASTREQTPKEATTSSNSSTAVTPFDSRPGLEALSRQPMRTPTKLRRGKAVGKEIDLDTWFTILSFSSPAQLLEMRTKIASCYRFLKNNPMLWKHSREFYYAGTLPDPPSELNEFQYAHLRHGHGCMSCGTPSTRKTYWAFLRRWCKACLGAKTIKEHEAMALFKNASGEDISFIQKCLPCGVFDSWGNFVGVGPASTHSVKSAYLRSDVNALVADFIHESTENRASWHAEMRTWMAKRTQVVEERHLFAQKMQAWEETARSSKSANYHAKKLARKLYFVEKASQLNPPILQRELDACPAFRRAILIPKEPNMTSWLQLKPKLEKEAKDLRARGGVQNSNILPPPMGFSFSGSSTPSIDFY